MKNPKTNKIVSYVCGSISILKNMLQYQIIFLPINKPAKVIREQTALKLGSSMFDC